jgi:hypothetical protein
MKWIHARIFILPVLAILSCKAQEKKSFVLQQQNDKGDVVMNWNKSTDEAEMKEDCKALAEYGVTINYKNIKRNTSDEIVAIKVEYKDRKGNKGILELDNQKPIAPIKFFKQGEEIGFGEPSNENSGVINFSNNQDFMKQFNFGNEDQKSQSYSFSFPNNGAFGQSSSKIIIQNDGKKTLIIEDGKVVEGGEDYSPEELQAILGKNKTEYFGDDAMKNFNFNFDDPNSNLDDLNKQLKKLQDQMNQKTPNLDKEDSNNSDSDLEKAKEELLKAKEDMLKAKEEMQKTTEELKKVKSTLKTQKA